MVDIDATLIIETLISIGFGGCFIVLATQNVAHTRGKVLKNHLVFLAITFLILLILPVDVRIVVFSPLGVRVVGSVYPLYESIRAVCSIDTKDDKLWLIYWISQGLVFYAIEFVESYEDDYDALRLYVYPAEFFFYVWLLLPYTDGAALIYGKIVKKYIAPLVAPCVAKTQGLLANIFSVAVSATHVYIVILFFIFFPPGLKRFIAVSIGVIYPLFSSIVAATTKRIEDDTFWLTYWSCFGLLFFIMEFLERYLGNVPGFYTAIVISEVYLMVPISNGAEKVFRHVLVPLARQEEMLILRDAYIVKRNMLAKVKEHRVPDLNEKINTLFSSRELEEEEYDDGDINEANSGSNIPPQGGTDQEQPLL